MEAGRAPPEGGRGGGGRGRPAWGSDAWTARSAASRRTTLVASAWADLTAHITVNSAHARDWRPGPSRGRPARGAPTPRPRIARSTRRTMLVASAWADLTAQICGR